MSDLKEIKTIGKSKILYSSFYGQYLVLLPKKNGTSEMHRTDTIDEAEELIGNSEKKYWWMQ